MIDYIVVTAHHARDLTIKVQAKITEGYIPLGGMNVVRTHEQLRFAGMQHKDTTYEHEYSQAMTRETIVREDLGPF